MSNLLEFMTVTKSIGYLIAIGFIIAFVAFWQLSYGRGKERVMTLAVASYMVVGLAILAGSCIAVAPR